MPAKITAKQSFVCRAKNLVVLARHNLAMLAVYLFALCLATLIFQRDWYLAQVDTPLALGMIDSITQADFFLGAAQTYIIGWCHVPLSLIFMLYCTRNDFLSPRVVRFRYIESFWLIQAGKALLAALLLAVAITLSVFFMGLMLGDGSINFDSFGSLFLLKTKTILPENPSLAYVGLITCAYMFLVLSLINLMWLLLDAILPKRWMALVLMLGFGVLNTRISLIYAIARADYQGWIPGVSFGFEYLIPMVVAMIAAGFIYYRIRGCPRARYTEAENIRDA